MAQLLAYLLCLISTTLLSEVGTVHVSKGLKVTLNHGGSLIGRHLETYHGRDINAFLGIPYAKPPVGDLRFRNPEPAEAWEGDRMATTDGSSCPIVDVFSGSMSYSGSEDCLFLNVYAPAAPKTKGPLPVMIWIHGGGYVAGDGTSASYHPKKLLDRDMVLVTLNYRLGIFGFLSSENLEIPGNFALKDQLMALKWVKEHIASFGGDPERITIFGQSAGSASVSHHTLSEKTKGLFHRAIGASAAYYDSWARPTHKGFAESQARKVAGIVGCDQNEESWTVLGNCLRNVSAESLAYGLADLIVWHIVPMPPFPVVIEPEHEGAYLTKEAEPSEYSNSIPLMMGFTKHESLVFLNMHYNYYDTFEQFKKDMEDNFELGLYSRKFPEQHATYIREKLMNFYFPDGEIEKNENLIFLFSDATFIAGVDQHLRSRLSKKVKSTAPTYAFQFEHRGEISHSYKPNDTFEGVCHGDDNFYLFPTAEKQYPTFRPSKRDRELSEKMIDMWYNFAAHGNPTPHGSGLPKWEPIVSYPPKTMRIGNLDLNAPLLEMTTEYPEERLNLWYELKPYLDAKSTPKKAKSTKKQCKVKN